MCSTPPAISGSLLALLAYPLIVEPLLTVHVQTFSWSWGYAAFALLMASLAFLVSRTPDTAAHTAHVESPAPPTSWRDRLTWVALAAIPSSLMLGVTTHITTDVASAPFLWVLPLALYLLTFIIAFQAKPAIRPDATLIFQAAAVAGCAMLMPFGTANFLLQLFVHLAAFFLTALMCHQALGGPPAAAPRADRVLSLDVVRRRRRGRVQRLPGPGDLQRCLGVPAGPRAFRAWRGHGVRGRSMRRPGSRWASPPWPGSPR